MPPLIQQLDELLPQTQCGQCGYGGCLPYAEAMATQNEQINRCPPGGEKALIALARVLNQDPAPYVEEMRRKQKPAQIAKIKTDECIGCMKCIKACPIDAIVGTAKQLHVVITAECTGCELCIEPCPVDCIELETVAKLAYNPQQAKKRHLAKITRQQTLKAEIVLPVLNTTQESPKKTYIQEAIARAKAKKSCF